MGNKRMISGELTDSTTWVEAPEVYMVTLFILMWTIADDMGRMKDIPRAIWGDTFAKRERSDVTIEMVETALQWLEGHGNIIRYTVEGEHFIQLRKFGKHQIMTRPRPSTMPPPPGWVDGVTREVRAPQPAKPAIPPAPKEKLMPGPTADRIAAEEEAARERGGAEGVGTLGDALRGRFDPAAPAVKREPPPGAHVLPPRTPDIIVPQPKTATDQKLYGELHSLLLAAGLEGLDAQPVSALDWIMRTDEQFAMALKKDGVSALGVVGARSGKTMYAVIAERYTAHLNGGNSQVSINPEEGQ